MRVQNNRNFGILGLIFILSMVGLFYSIKLLDYNQFAVEKEFGVLKKDIKTEGFNYVGIGSLIYVNNQVRNYNLVIDSASKDYQSVKLNLNLNLKIKKEEVYNFIKEYKDESTFKNYLDNKISEKVKSIVLKYNAEEFLEKRLLISNEILKQIKVLKGIEKFELQDFIINDIEFSDTFVEILERKGKVRYEKNIILQEKENLVLRKKNFEIIGIDDYVKLQIVDKWDGKSSLIISENFLIGNK
jgi:regulator of protease activity HflC (stomatin/prohibitin superfamily)